MPNLAFQLFGGIIEKRLSGRQFEVKSLGEV
jgi:hypothetical protein